MEAQHSIPPSSLHDLLGESLLSTTKSFGITKSLVTTLGAVGPGNQDFIADCVTEELNWKQTLFKR
jgi:hypothetical protein